MCTSLHNFTLTLWACPSSIISSIIYCIIHLVPDKSTTIWQMHLTSRQENFLSMGALYFIKVVCHTFWIKYIWVIDGHKSYKLVRFYDRDMKVLTHRSRSHTSSSDPVMMNSSRARRKHNYYTGHRDNRMTYCAAIGPCQAGHMKVCFHYHTKGRAKGLYWHWLSNGTLLYWHIILASWCQESVAFLLYDNAKHLKTCFSIAPSSVKVIISGGWFA